MAALVANWGRHCQPSQHNGDSSNTGVPLNPSSTPIVHRGYLHGNPGDILPSGMFGLLPPWHTRYACYHGQASAKGRLEALLPVFPFSNDEHSLCCSL